MVACVYLLFSLYKSNSHIYEVYPDKKELSIIVRKEKKRIIITTRRSDCAFDYKYHIIYFLFLVKKIT